MGARTSPEEARWGRATGPSARPWTVGETNSLRLLQSLEGLEGQLQVDQPAPVSTGLTTDYKRT